MDSIELIKQQVAERILDLDYVKDRIVPRLIGRELNADVSANRTQLDMDDFSVTFHVMIGESGDDVISAPVTDELLKVCDMKKVVTIRLDEREHKKLCRLAGKESKQSIIMSFVSFCRMDMVIHMKMYMIL